MAKSYLDLMKQARSLAEKDIQAAVEKLREFGQHFPELVDKAIASISRNGAKPKTAMVTMTPMPKASKATPAEAPAGKKRKRRKLTKVETQELRELVNASLKGKVKQVDFIETFLSDHPGYKAATVQNIISEFRKSKTFKDEPVVKGNTRAGIYLIPGK